MKTLVLLIPIFWSAQCLAVTNSASFLAQCQSMTLANPNGTDSTFGQVATSFTTYDGASTLPLRVDLGIVSGELRPRAQTGVYETDYYMAFTIGYEFGYMLLNLPTNDVDTNGLPDFLQADTAVNAALGAGSSGRMDYPGTSSFTVAGQFRRNADALRGTYDLTIQVGGRTITHNTTSWSLLRIAGALDYSREEKNFMQLSLTLTNGNGTSATLTGSAFYTAPDANNLVLPQLALRRNQTQQIILAPMTLTRSGHRYRGNAVAADGNLATPWADYTRFVIEIVDDNDSNTNGIPDLTDPTKAPDSTEPRVAFTSPATNVRVTNAIFTVRGTASDNIGIARVEYALGTNAFQTALGTNNWSFAIPLELGTNLVFVVAYDFRGNASPLAFRRIIRAPTSPLVLTRSSNGVVTPNLNGANLILGDRYTVTAVPAARHVFAGWTGSIQTNTARLTFIMQSNLMLHANFVTNPFIAVKGTYLGLFSDANQPANESSGAFRATVTERGTFTATLRTGGRSYTVAGQFDLEGKATRQIRFQTTNLLTATLDLDLTSGTDQITGELATPQWTATLLAYRPPIHGRTDPSPSSGRHTLYLTGGVDASSPAGNGVAAIVVKTNGTMTLAGMLGDGTKATQETPISKDGLWPLYVPLYAGKGSVSGWLMFTNDAGFSIAGRANWFKPSVPKDKLYPGGFTNAPYIYGSTYSAPLMTNFLGTNTTACLYVIGLGAELQTNCLTLVAKNTYGGPGVKALKLDLPTGLWSGTYTNPVTGRPLPLKATLLQPRGLGFGYVLGTNLSAGVVFLPSP